MKRKLKICAAAVLSAVLFAVSAPVNGVSAASGISVEYRTPEEIADYMNSHPFEYTASEYDEIPDYTNAPYSAGKLSDATLLNALNALNTIRYIAGIGEVGLSDSYSELAQAGALVNAVNDELSHSPSQPDDMPDELYELGLSGTSSSNLGWGYSSLAQDIVYGWMSDSSSSNIDRVGHRRWCLNPSMEQTGFGNVGKYYAMYAFDNTWGDTQYYGVCWPAQVMPAEYFEYDDPWSISMGTAVDISAVEVTLERQSDGRTWLFSEDSADGYFNVENSNYGKKGCIIFRPEDISYSVGDSFEVTITGLSQTVNYTVDFVDVFSTQPEITETNLHELVNFLVNREYNADEVTDFSGDGNVDVFDAVYARRSLLD